MGKTLRRNRVLAYSQNNQDSYQLQKGKWELFSEETQHDQLNQVIKVNVTNNETNQHHVPLS